MPTPNWPHGYVPTAQEWYDALFNQVGPTGPTGPAGPQGDPAAAITWLYSTQTSDADPGSEYLRFNNADPALATTAYVSNDALGGDVSAWLDSFDDFGNSSSRGQLLIAKQGDATEQMIVQVTGSIVDGTGYRKISLTVISGGLTLVADDELSFQWFPRGPAGTGDLSSANNLSDLASPKTGFDNISVHGADVASAGTIDLDAATGVLIDVTGTTTITAITLSNGRERVVRFTGSLTLTNGASLVLPGGANIITQAGDFAIFRGYAAGVVRCVAFSPIAGYGALSRSNTWAKPQTPTSAAMSSGVAFDFSTYQVATLAVSGAFTVSAPSANPATGTYVQMVISMTASGSLSFNSVFKGMANYTQSTWASGTMRDHLTFRWDGTNYDLVGVAKGVNQ